ncbi:MAG: hypothetical protein J5830_06425, partial [Clostridia bacterium]|nr:hypothetical protein [Clostridia bacterium]
MGYITDLIRNENEYGAVLTAIREQSGYRRPHPCRLIGLPDGTRSALFAALSEDNGTGPTLILTSNYSEMRRVASDLTELGRRVFCFPPRDPVFYNITGSHEAEHERMAALSSLLRGEADIVVATSDAAVQFTCPRERLENLMMQISASEPISIEEIASVLNAGGYVNVELVDGEGQFSVRGGIVDIFTPGDSSPVRIELFGDEIDSMSRFDALTQRRTVDAEGVFIIPAREVLPDERSRKKIAG